MQTWEFCAISAPTALRMARLVHQLMGSWITKFAKKRTSPCLGTRFAMSRFKSIQYGAL